MEAAITPHTALSDAAIGLELRDVWSTRASARRRRGFVAAHLLDPSSSFAPYLATLPARTADLPQHVLWWDAHEVALLDGTTAARECASIRDEVDDVCRVLRDGALSSLVAAHGDDAVDEAVRRAFVALFSRSFDLPDAFDLGTCLVPLLDCLQHSAAPSVRYGWGEGEGGESRLEGRAVGSLAAGTELSISYGEHPDMVFGSHYGFVPPLMQQPSSCYTVLRLGDELADGGMGAAAVLAAQLRRKSAGLTTTLLGTTTTTRRGAWRGCGRRPAPSRLAAAAVGTARRAARLRRLVDLDRAARGSARAGGRDALQRLDARACAPLRADEQRRADDDDAQTDAAVRAVLSAGSVDAANDADAARLVECAWAARGARSSAGDAAAAGAPRRRRAPRAGASALRASEAIVLRRLADGGEVAALF